MEKVFPMSLLMHFSIMLLDTVHLKHFSIIFSKKNYKPFPQIIKLLCVMLIDPNSPSLLTCQILTAAE